MYGSMKDKYPNNLPSDDLSTDAKFYKLFKPTITEAQPHHIWSFEQIGLFDPFPLELMESKFEIPETKDSLVYNEIKYIPGNSPNMIYFPSKLLLFKIMKACIGVENK